jgi:phosphodiesterase/alkaline phosphatase D-like protein
VSFGPGAVWFDLSGLAPGTTYYYKAKAVTGGDLAYGVEKSFTTIDATAPVISSVRSDNITASRTNITWTTNEAATTQVEYGLTTAYGATTSLDTNLVTSHSVSLTSLSNNSTYHYRVISKDASNNQAVSADGTFTTAKSSGGMPTWAWVIIGVGAVGIVGAAAYFTRRRGSSHSSQ